jgi:hypothetical protein
MKLQVTAPSCLRINGNVPALCFIQWVYIAMMLVFSFDNYQ